MAKKSGSKSSRSERRAGRKRAERAREHGLPTRKEPQIRVRAATPEPGSDRETADRSSDAPPAGVPKSGGIPTLVKVVGGALVILIGVYLLSQKRDEALTETPAAPEPPASASALVTSASAPAPVVAEPAPPPATPEPAPEPALAPVEAAATAVVAPAQPVVAVPKAAKPAPVAAPKTPAAPAPSPVPAPANPAPPAAAAKPVAPKPAPAAPPVDNPY